MRERIRAAWSAALHRIGRALLGRVVFLPREGEVCLIAEGVSAAASPWVMVIGREWYEESIVRLPRLGWLETRRVLQLQYEGQTGVLFQLARVENAARMVRVFRLSPRAMERASRALWVLPETALFSKQSDYPGVLEVRRAGCSYFLASDQPSQIAGGLVARAEIYGLSVGAREPEAFELIDEPEFFARLTSQLKKLHLSDWLGFVNRSLVIGSAQTLKKPALVAAATFAVYMVVVSAWLSWSIRTRQAEADALAPKVSTLVAKQREIEQFANEYSVIAERWKEKKTGVVIWWLASEVWKQNGAVVSASFANNEAVLQGTVRNAATLLSVLSASPAVENVRFNGPVTRLSDESEQFSLTITIRDESFLSGGVRAP